MLDAAFEEPGQGLRIIRPRWPAPDTVRAAVTTRLGGVSGAPYDSLNLATHVEDDARAVAENRTRLSAALALPSQPHWLQQVHGTDVVDVAGVPLNTEADAAVARRPGDVCVVMTADCLPVFFCDAEGGSVGVAHAGWRGLAAGVLEAMLDAMPCSAGQVLAWMGPAIGSQAFEVGAEVRERFVSRDPGCMDCFAPAARAGHFYADIYALARRRLLTAGVQGVYGGGLCTYNDPENFYSYRRDGECGRMASLIWLAGG